MCGSCHFDKVSFAFLLYIFIFENCDGLPVVKDLFCVHTYIPSIFYDFCLSRLYGRDCHKNHGTKSLTIQCMYGLLPNSSQFSMGKCYNFFVEFFCGIFCGITWSGYHTAIRIRIAWRRTSSVFDWTICLDDWKQAEKCKWPIFPVIRSNVYGTPEQSAAGFWSVCQFFFTEKTLSLSSTGLLLLYHKKIFPAVVNRCKYERKSAPGVPLFLGGGGLDILMNPNWNVSYRNFARFRGSICRWFFLIKKNKGLAVSCFASSLPFFTASRIVSSE